MTMLCSYTIQLSHITLSLGLVNLLKICDITMDYLQRVRHANREHLL